MTTDLLIQIIKEYVPHTFATKDTKKKSYQQWAVYEICNRLMDNPLASPIDVFEEFIFEMITYSYQKDNETTKMIFQTAADTAEEIALLFV